MFLTITRTSIHVGYLLSLLAEESLNNLIILRFPEYLKRLKVYSKCLVIRRTEWSVIQRPIYLNEMLYDQYLECSHGKTNCRSVDCWVIGWYWFWSSVAKINEKSDAKKRELLWTSKTNERKSSHHHPARHSHMIPEVVRMNSWIISSFMRDGC